MIPGLLAAKGARSAWNDKIGRILILSGVGYLGYKVLSVAGQVTDTVKTIVGLPQEFFKGLVAGWSEQKPSAEAKENLQKILNTIKVKASALSFNTTTYITIANTLQAQMQGFNFPGQFAAIENTLKGCSAEDFKAVWLAFGLRKSTGVAQEYENLTQWLQGDLSKSNYAILQTRFKASGLL